MVLHRPIECTAEIGHGEAMRSRSAHKEVKDDLGIVAAESGGIVKFEDDGEKCALPNNRAIRLNREFLTLI
jgi:hypothetical protein